VKKAGNADNNLRNCLNNTGQWINVLRKSDKDERNYLREAGFE